MMRLILLIVAAFAAAATGADGVTTITLKFRAEPGAAAGGYTIGEVASIDGPMAAQIAGLPVRPAGDRIDATVVRAALRDAGLNLGLLVVGGQPCRLVMATTAPEARPASTPRAEAPETVWVEGDTVRTRIIDRLAAGFDVHPDDLQLGFDSRDTGLLNSLATDQTVVIKPLGSADRMPLSVQIFQGDRLLMDQTIRVAVKVRRSVLVATRSLDREDTIDLACSRPQRMWLAPSIRAADPDRSMGMVVRSRIDAGGVIEARDIEAPVIVRKGDLVTIECLSGTIRLKTIARAMGSARDGEICAFRVAGSEHTFHARMNGRGRAVTVTGAHPVSSHEALESEGTR